MNSIHGNDEALLRLNAARVAKKKQDEEAHWAYSQSADHTRREVEARQIPSEMMPIETDHQDCIG